MHRFHTLFALGLVVASHGIRLRASVGTVEDNVEGNADAASISASEDHVAAFTAAWNANLEAMRNTASDSAVAFDKLTVSLATHDALRGQIAEAEEALAKAVQERNAQEEIKQEIDGSNETYEELEKRKKDLDSDIARVERELKSASSDIKAAETTWKNAKANEAKELDRITKDSTACTGVSTDTINELRKIAAAEKAKLLNIRGELRENDMKLQQKESRIKQLTAKIAKDTNDLDKSAQELQNAESKITEIQQRASELVSRAQGLDAELQNTRAEVEAQRRLANAKMANDPVLLELPVVGKENEERICGSDKVAPKFPDVAIVLCRDGHLKRHDFEDLLQHANVAGNNIQALVVEHNELAGVIQSAQNALEKLKEQAKDMEGPDAPSQEKLDAIWKSIDEEKGAEGELRLAIANSKQRWAEKSRKLEDDIDELQEKQEDLARELETSQVKLKTLQERLQRTKERLDRKIQNKCGSIIADMLTQSIRSMGAELNEAHERLRQLKKDLNKNSVEEAEVEALNKHVEYEKAIAIARLTSVGGRMQVEEAVHSESSNKAMSINDELLDAKRAKATAEAEASKLAIQDLAKPL